MGTTSPVAVREYASELAQDGFTLVDAPVSGGDAGATDGSLSIMVGRPEAEVARVTPVLRAMGTSVRHMCPVGSGQLAKACNQIVVAATLTALGEAVTLGARAGLDAAELLHVLSGGLAGSRALAVPLTAVVDQLFGAMRWTGRGDHDHSGIVQIIEDLSGRRRED